MKRTNWLARALGEIGWIVKQAWNDFQSSGHCCGWGLQQKETACPETMPTAGSCCGVRF